MKWLALCLLLTGCSPSCEDNGGKTVQEGFIYIPQTIGNMTILQMYPNYVCKMEGK
jgi:hypothetical protein